MRHGFGSLHARREFKRAMKMAAMVSMAGGGFGRGFGRGFDPFAGGGPFGGGHGHGHGGGRRRRFGRDELRLVLLHLIAEEPRHGYDLIKAIEERTAEQYAPSPGVVYPALQMLADEGLVAEQASDDARRRFAITDAGREVLSEQAEAVEAALARLDRMGERAERGRRPQIERAAANLFMAVRQRMGEGGKDDLAHDIAEILDDAAQRIERL